MSKKLHALEKSLDKFGGATMSCLVSRKNGLTLFRAGTENSGIDVDAVNRGLSKLFSSNLSNPYGDAWEMPEIHWVYMKVSPNKSIFAVPIAEDFFWSLVINGQQNAVIMRANMEDFSPQVLHDFETVRSR